MPNSSPPLERATGGLTLLVMLVLFALTLGTPTDAAPAPIIIVATPVLERGAVLSPQLQVSERQAPPVTVAVPTAQPLPSPAPTLEAEIAVVVPAPVLAPVVEVGAPPPTTEPSPPPPPSTVEPTAAIVRQVGRMTIVRERLPERQERP